MSEPNDKADAALRSAVGDPTMSKAAEVAMNEPIPMPGVFGRIRAVIAGADWSGLLAAAERVGRAGREFAAAAEGMDWRSRLTTEQLAQLRREEDKGSQEVSAEDRIARALSLIDTWLRDVSDDDDMVRRAMWNNVREVRAALDGGSTR